MNVTDFYQSIEHATGDQREVLILVALLGVAPTQWCPVTFKGRDFTGRVHDVTLWASPDYLGVGDATGFFRVPMHPKTARTIADRMGAVLPTREMVERTYACGKATGVVLPYHPITQKFFKDQGKSMTSSWAYKVHNDRLEATYNRTKPGRDKLTVGQKKDITVTPRLLDPRYRKNVAIFGWYDEKGKPIQDLNYVDHTDTYGDYSHGARLYFAKCDVDGAPLLVADVLNHPVLHPLLSDEGPLDYRKMYV